MLISTSQNTCGNHICIDHQIISFHTKASSRPNTVAITPEVSEMLDSNCVVAIGVSGGKDSVACAVAVDRYLKEIGHQGPKLLIHSDLGRVEWKDSLPACKRLAAKIGWELVVVKRKAGDMLARWEGRWLNNVARYRDLSCVKLILPWSTPSLRFCTSELKTQVVISALKKRFPDQHILNVTGIRREESPNRSRMPISAPMKQLTRRGYTGMAWNPIIEWPIQDVFYAISEAGLALHEAYTVYGASRVSCAYCIMSTLKDLLAAASCEDNHEVYRLMVELEAISTFAFQGNHWLGDVAPHLLSEELLARLARAKVLAKQRQEIEAELPKHLMYVKGWPIALPTPEEAELIASIRRRVSDLLGLEAKYLTGPDVMRRYEELMSLHANINASVKNKVD